MERSEIQRLMDDHCSVAPYRDSNGDWWCRVDVRASSEEHAIQLVASFDAMAFMMLPMILAGNGD